MKRFHALDGFTVRVARSGEWFKLTVLDEDEKPVVRVTLDTDQADDLAADLDDAGAGETYGAVQRSAAQYDAGYAAALD